MRGKVKYHVAAGSFAVAKREQRIRQAFLGTTGRLAELGLSMSSQPDLVDAIPEDLFSASPDATFKEGVAT